MNIELEPHRPQLIIVSGRPGAGKTTLARALSLALRCPLVSRDEIHNGINRTLGVSHALSTTERFRDLTFQRYFQTIEFFLSTHVTIVVEAAFGGRIWRRKLDPALALADAKVIQCELHGDIAYERNFPHRAAEREAHRRLLGHSTASANAHRTTVQDFEHLSLPVPTIRVDTSDSYDPSFEKILAFASSRHVDNPA